MVNWLATAIQLSGELGQLVGRGWSPSWQSAIAAMAHVPARGFPTALTTALRHNEPAPKSGPIRPSCQA